MHPEDRPKLHPAVKQGKILTHGIRETRIAYCVRMACKYWKEWK